MKSRISCRRWRFIIFVILVTIHFTICDARISINMLKKINLVLHSQNTEPYGLRNPDSSLPPFESISPLPLPAQTTPAFCIYLPPSSSAPAPVIHSPPAALLVPPSSPSRPKFPHSPSLPKCGASPPKHAPRPPLYHPPVVFPPPSTPPQQHKSPASAVWCVAKPSVPDQIMKEALDYACGAGANCKPIQPSEPCYQPDTLLAHASFAFNSYFQNKKILGGTCDFGGAAMLVTVDPSFNGCHFAFG